MSVIGSILFSLLASGQVATGPQTAPAASTDQAVQVDDVQVNARRQAAYDTARAFVDEVVETPPNRGLARWDGTVCVGVANMQAAIAQPLVDRISDNVASVGLTVGEPGCKPNVLIVATNDGAAMARGLVQAKPRAFNPGVSGTRLTLRALEQFQSNEATVRWWRITLPVDEDTGEPTVRLRGEEPTYRAIRSPSRLRTQDRNIFTRVFIILDVNKAAGMDVGALGDYLAMAALAQVDANADMSGFSTVLNLFSDPAAPRTMTDWDRDYLKALYTAELNERNVNQQVGSAARSIARERQAREDAAD